MPKRWVGEDEIDQTNAWRDLAGIALKDFNSMAAIDWIHSKEVGLFSAILRAVTLSCRLRWAGVGLTSLLMSQFQSVSSFATRVFFALASNTSQTSASYRSLMS